MGHYDYLKNQYPETVSLEQMYKICHMAKRSVKYLLDNGIVPCIDSGKKTCRYSIKIEDIITYLENRNHVGTQIPKGMMTTRKNHPRPPRLSFASIILCPDIGEEVRKYFEFIYSDFPDTVDTIDLVEMTGLDKKLLHRLLKSGAIESLKVDNKYIVPKCHVMSFVLSKQYFDIKSNSSRFMRILGGFEKWQAAKS